MAEVTEGFGAFLAAWSREIRTPMNAVLGMAGLLLDTALTDDQRRLTETLRESGDAVLGMINDLFDFATAEAGRLELEHQPFEVRECVESALGLLAGQAERKHLDLAYLIDPSVPSTVVGDVSRLRQILVTLVGNGIKFTDEGEVVVSVAAETLPEESGGGDDRLHRLRFSVRDTGAGIPEGRLQELFGNDPGRDPASPSLYVGTGLGLAITRHLVKLMGGTIGAESKLLQGSTVSFSVVARAPAFPGAGVAEPAPAAPIRVGAAEPVIGVEDLTSAEGLPLRILVAEDNSINQQLALLLLEKLDYTADVAGDGTEVLHALERRPYDVVLMDVVMPGMDGLEATRRIRERWPEAQRPRIIAMTGSTMPGDREMCLAAGMDDYLTKPVRLAELARALRRSRPRGQHARPGPLDPPVLVRVAEPQPGAAAMAVFEPGAIERLLATLDDDGPLRVADLIAAFVEESPRALVQLRDALDRDEAEAVRRVAHSLKSSATRLGAVGFSSRCRQIEMAAKAAELATARDLASALDQEFDQARDALEAVAETLERGAASA